MLHHDLGRTLCPTRLLLFIARHLARDFAGYGNIAVIGELPALEDRAIAQVEIFAEGVPMPTASVFNRAASPYTARTIEDEWQTAMIARELFHHEMPINTQRLTAR